MLGPGLTGQKHRKTEANITSFAKRSIARSPCRTGRPFSTEGVYDVAACVRGRNAAGPEKKKLII